MDEYELIWMDMDEIKTEQLDPEKEIYRNQL